MEKWNKCFASGKVRYAEPGEAKYILTRIKSMKRHYAVDGKRVNRRQTKKKQSRYYYCQHCRGFHLTSTETSENRIKLMKERKIRIRTVDQMYKTPEQGDEWKKDGLPFPSTNEKPWQS